ncbi:MAG TPA: hypothetical protein VEQ63_01290 [Bryobacteraceae bacterium]|nr:hypothetical protein [Bryobacteraceae bacterium]
MLHKNTYFTSGLARKIAETFCALSLIAVLGAPVARAATTTECGIVGIPNLPGTVSEADRCRVDGSDSSYAEALASADGFIFGNSASGSSSAFATLHSNTNPDWIFASASGVYELTFRTSGSARMGRADLTWSAATDNRFGSAIVSIDIDGLFRAYCSGSSCESTYDGYSEIRQEYEDVLFPLGVLITIRIESAASGYGSSEGEAAGGLADGSFTLALYEENGAPVTLHSSLTGDGTTTPEPGTSALAVPILGLLIAKA